MPSGQRLNSGESVHANFRFPNANSIHVGSIEWREPRSERRAVGMIDLATELHKLRRRAQRFDGMCSRREWIEKIASGVMTRMNVTFPLVVLATAIIPTAAEVKDCTRLDRWPERCS